LVLAGAFGVLVPATSLPTPVRMALIVGPALALAALTRASAPFARWLRGLDRRRMTALHLVRLPIGAAFLALGERGLLAPEFARAAGGGDVVAAVLLGLVVLAWRESRGFHAFAFAANLFGALDFMNVFRTVNALAAAGRNAELALFDSPAAAVPFCVVPVLLFTHGVLLAEHGRALAGRSPQR
ncbi:MAG: hypothetical protein AAGH15_28685, partial [Myxococcota bacterium]